jgi:hypothetical protein
MAFISAKFVASSWESGQKKLQRLQRSWLRHYAVNKKVVGSIPDEVIRFFSWRNPPSRTMALGSTQPLTEMSTWNLPGVNGGRRVRLTTSLL